MSCQQRYYDVIDKLDKIWSQNHTCNALKDLSDLHRYYYAYHQINTNANHGLY